MYYLIGVRRFSTLKEVENFCKKNTWVKWIKQVDPDAHKVTILEVIRDYPLLPMRWKEKPMEEWEWENK